MLRIAKRRERKPGPMEHPEFFIGENTIYERTLNAVKVLKILDLGVLGSDA
jgi:hypothetical protein